MKYDGRPENFSRTFRLFEFHDKIRHTSKSLREVVESRCFRRPWFSKKVFREEEAKQGGLDLYELVIHEFLCVPVSPWFTRGNSISFMTRLVTTQYNHKKELDTMAVRVAVATGMVSCKDMTLVSCWNNTQQSTHNLQGRNSTVVC